MRCDVWRAALEQAGKCSTADCIRGDLWKSKSCTACTQDEKAVSNSTAVDQELHALEDGLRARTSFTYPWVQWAVNMMLKLAWHACRVRIQTCLRTALMRTRTCVPGKVLCASWTTTAVSRQPLIATSRALAAQLCTYMSHLLLSR